MTNEEFREIAKQIPPSHPNMEWSFRMDCIRNHFMMDNFVHKLFTKIFDFSSTNCQK